jgi:hypothetical protein
MACGAKVASMPVRMRLLRETPLAVEKESRPVTLDSFCIPRKSHYTSAVHPVERSFTIGSSQPFTISVHRA